MKLSQILCKHHIGRQIRQLWYIQGKKTLINTNTENILLSYGIQVENAEAVTKEALKPSTRSTEFFQQLIPSEVKTPLVSKDTYYSYKDNNLLVEGLSQAQNLTKTIVFNDVLPESLETLSEELSEQNTQLVKRIIQTSAIFDAYQQLLPKIKDPNRPAFNFPNQLGITDVRKISNLSKKFIQLCDCICGPNIANSRSTVDDAFISLSFEKDLEKYQLSLTMDIILMSEEPLKQIKKIEKQYDSMLLPSIYPLHHSIGLTENNCENFKNSYPLISGYKQKNIHTIFIYYDKTKVKNVTELETTETQIFGRALMKAFTAAYATAKQRFGSEIKILPEPVTVQCIQSDGKAFYFSVFQLNTLDLNGVNGIKNYYWCLSKLNLYDTAGYVNGKPTLEGYNPEVFRRILAFYKNQ